MRWNKTRTVSCSLSLADKVVSSAIKAVMQKDRKQVPSQQVWEAGKKGGTGDGEFTVICQKADLGRDGETWVGRHLEMSYPYSREKCKASLEKVHCRVVRIELVLRFWIFLLFLYLNLESSWAMLGSRAISLKSFMIPLCRSFQKASLAVVFHLGLTSWKFSSCFLNKAYPVSWIRHLRFPLQLSVSPLGLEYPRHSLWEALIPPIRPLLPFYFL